VKQKQSEAAKDTGKISPERLAPVPREEK
jgi:hypothetical protein